MQAEGRVALVVTETVLTALLGWLAWCGFWLLLMSEEWGTASPLTPWERYSRYLRLMALALLPLILWALLTLAVGLLLRERPAGLRAIAAMGVALLWDVVPVSVLVATSAESSGGATWGLVLILAVAVPIGALTLYGLVAAVLDALPPGRIRRWAEREDIGR